MREIINLGIGQCGINITEQFYNDLIYEHNIDNKGFK
jgi:hypothetical protein